MKSQVRYWQLLILFASVGYFVFAASANQADEIKILWKRTLADKSELIFKRQHEIKFRDKNNISREGLPTNAVIIGGNYITDRYNLTILRNGKSETVWEGVDVYVEGMEGFEGVGVIHSNLESQVGQWRHLDDQQIKKRFKVEVFDGEVYLLFASMGRIQLQVRGVNSSGDWTTASTTNIGAGADGELLKIDDRLEILFVTENGKVKRLDVLHRKNGLAVLQPLE